MRLILLWLCILMVGVPSLAMAYVDPGSITIFLQVIGAFALGALITMRQKISSFFQALFSRFKSDSGKKGEKNDRT